MQKLRIHWKICLQIKENMLAVVGSGMSSFKLAAAFMEKEKRDYLPMQILVRKFFWENISLAKI